MELIQLEPEAGGGLLRNELVFSGVVWVVSRWGQQCVKVAGWTLLFGHTMYQKNCMTQLFGVGKKARGKKNRQGQEVILVLVKVRRKDMRKKGERSGKKMRKEDERRG